MTFDTNEPQPKEEKLQFEKLIYFNDFEQTGNSEEQAYLGGKSYNISSLQEEHDINILFKDFNIEGGDFIKISFKGYIGDGHLTPLFENHERITTVIYDSSGSQKRYRGISVQPYLG